MEVANYNSRMEVCTSRGGAGVVMTTWVLNAVNER